jgi:hypothetical protein
MISIVEDVHSSSFFSDFSSLSSSLANNRSEAFFAFSSSSALESGFGFDGEAFLFALCCEWPSFFSFFAD